MRYKLPSGGTVTLRDPATLKARDSKALMAKMGKAAKDVDQTDDAQLAEAGINATDELIAALVTDWQLPYPTEDGRPWLLPNLDLTLINDLRADDYGRIMGLVTPAQEILMPRKVDPGTYEDLDSPTVPASA